MDKKFLFTYSVIARSSYEQDERAANTVRDRIATAKVRGWRKLENVETAFTGEFSVEGGTPRERRNHATRQVEKVIKEKFEGVSPHDAPTVQVALFVDDLDGIIEFKCTGE